MTILVTLPDYDKTEGFKFQWEDGFTITVKNENTYIEIAANKKIKDRKTERTISNYSYVIVSNI